MSNNTAQAKSDEHILVTFTSTHDAIAFEKCALQLGVKVTLIPVPRDISTSCGLAARFPVSRLRPVLTTLDDGKASVEKFYLLSEK